MSLTLRALGLLLLGVLAGSQAAAFDASPGDAEPVATLEESPLERGDAGGDAASSQAAPRGPDERVEVRAEPPEIDDVAAFATTIDGAEARERGLGLADLLRRAPGARVREYGGMGSFSTLSLRGSTADQVTVFVDGVPQNRAFGGPVDLSSIPATQLDRVTVYRGFGPARFGQGGMGGVVDVRTLAAEEDAGVQVSLLAGELDTRRVSASGSVPTGAKGGLRIGAEGLSSSGDYVFLDAGETLFNATDDVWRERVNNDVEQTTLLLQHAQRGVGPGSLRTSLRLERRDRGLPGLGSFSSATARFADSLGDASVAWTLGERRGSLEEIDLQLDGFRNSFRLQDAQGEIGLRSQEQTTRLEGGGVAGLARWRLGIHRLLARVDFRAETARVRDVILSPPDRGGARRRLATVTLEEMVTVGSTTLAPTVQLSHVRDDFRPGSTGTLAPPALDRSEPLWSARLGVSQRLGRRSSLRGSVGRYYRVPSLVELFGDRGPLVGNPALVPETGLSLELGWARDTDRAARPWQFELVGFARRSENLIRFLPVSQGVAVARNVANSDVYGLESSLTWKALRGLSIHASGTLQRATDTSDGFTRGRPLPYQPRTLGYAGIDGRLGGFRGRWDLYYTGENGTDALDTIEFRLPARVIHDVTLAWVFAGGTRVGLDVRNLLDRRTRDLLRYPLPDRVVLVHVGWDSGARQ